MVHAGGSSHAVNTDDDKRYGEQLTHDAGALSMQVNNKKAPKVASTTLGVQNSHGPSLC